MNQISKFYSLLHIIAIAGNIIFGLWILINGINEGFRGTAPEIVSYVGLMILLLLNTILLFRQQKKNN